MEPSYYLPLLIAQTALALAGLIVDIVPAAIPTVRIIAADVAPDPVDAGGAVAAAELATGEGDFLSFVFLFHDSFLLCNGDDIRSDSTSAPSKVRKDGITGDDDGEIQLLNRFRHTAHDGLNVGQVDIGKRFMS